MFVEWYDSWGEPQLSWLPCWKALFIIICGLGFWVPKNQIVIEGDE